jgi:hypothetical protein
MTTRKDEVKVFASDNIHNLLLGNQPVVGSRKSRARESVRAANADGIDFSRFAFPPEIEPAFKSAANPKNSVSLSHERPASRVSSIHFEKVRAEEANMGHMTALLDEYSINNTRKTLRLHQEMEEHLLQPLGKRLCRRLVGPRYQSHLQERQRAVTSFDQMSKKVDSYGEELPEIPCIRVAISDLGDPIAKYRAHIPDEKRLGKLIMEADGLVPPPSPVNERDTMNLRQWRILSETRCYHGNTDVPVRKGKRSLSNARGTSCLAYELDCFPPFKDRSVAYRQVPPWARDHVTFDDA